MAQRLGTGVAVDAVISSEPDLRTLMATLARTKRMVFFAGLPGVGKSLLIRELARTAHAASRTVHILQWDTVRLPFVSPATEKRYPEQGGQTHAMLRRAIGRWARKAVLSWDRQYDESHILLGEVPLVGSRLLDLVQVQDDAVESLLAGPEVLFITPVPSIATRRVIERARSHTSAHPAHPREREDAPSDILQKVWQDVHALAVTLGVAASSADERIPFDPQSYAEVYRHLLRHRPALMLWMEANLEPSGSVYDLQSAAEELVPTTEDAFSIVAQLEHDHTAEEIEQSVANWFQTV
jgi:hypothetical protein